MDILQKNGESSTSAIVDTQGVRGQDMTASTSHRHEHQQPYLSQKSEATEASSRAIIPHEWNREFN